VAKLRKICHVEILSVGPAKEEKKEEPKKMIKRRKMIRKIKKKDNVIINPLMHYGTPAYYNHQMKPPGPSL